MRGIVRYTEQLQLAGSFLHEKSHQLARLSLILCDNVVELLAHERCERHVQRASFWLSAPKLSDGDRADARGQEFAPKLNLLVRLGDVTPDERDFATRAHFLRNECYHTAAMHEQIAWQVAWDYHELACALFDKLSPGAYVMGDKIDQSEATRKILKAAGIDGGFRIKVEKAIEKLIVLLRATKPPRGEMLGKVLSDAAVKRFTNLIDAIEFIAHDGLNTNSFDDVIRAAFFAATVDTKKLLDGIDTHTHEGFIEFHRRRERAQAEYTLPFRFTCVKGWLSRAEKLANEKSAARAMVKYIDLLKQSADADTIIHEMASELDSAIQLQVDIARGK